MRTASKLAGYTKRLFDLKGYVRFLELGFFVKADLHLTPRFSGLRGIVRRGLRPCVGRTEKLEVLDDHAHFAALPAAVLVIPRVVFQPAFNEQRLALFAILLNDLGLFAERGAVDERDLVTIFARLRAIPPIHCQSKLTDSRVARQRFRL